MPPKSYKFVYDEYGNTKEIKVHTRGIGVHGNNYVNKGTAFSEAERRELGMEGSLPPAVRPLRQQVKNSLEKVLKKEDDIERYIYMRSLFDRNVTLAHAVIATDISRFMEIIYTPTVGLACQQYSSMFRSANGVRSSNSLLRDLPSGKTNSRRSRPSPLRTAKSRCVAPGCGYLIMVGSC